MAVEELVQVRMSVSLDFADRGELVWVTKEHADGLAAEGLARVVQEVGHASGAGEGDGEPAGGDGARRTRKRAGGPADS